MFYENPSVNLQNRSLLDLVVHRFMKSFHNATTLLEIYARSRLQLIDFPFGSQFLKDSMR